MRSRCLLAVVVALALVAACHSGAPSSDGPTNAGSRVEGEWFTDQAVASGLDFVHFNGMSGELYYPEMFGPGVGLIDIDNDNDLDVYVTQGQLLGGTTLSPSPGPAERAGRKTMADATYPPKRELRDRVFRNDLTIGADSRRLLRFTDVTEQIGVDIRTYGMGVAAGDFDNDGWVDIYRTGLERGVMLRNNGDGTFSDVTARTRTANAGSWGVSASFVDYDRDGWLDLYIGNYLEYSLANDVDCISVTGRPDYCAPGKYPAQRDRLYRNRGNGTFEDVTMRALTGGAYGPALGVSTADFNGDGWIDIYVGNDGQPNQLWINQGDGTFRDAAFVSGVAVSGQGAPEASMGIDAGDFDNDGDDDLIVTNWASQMNALYVNEGGSFEDRRGPAGLGAPSLPKTGFGVAWFDAENDGWLDLLTVNGGVSLIEAQARAKDPFPFRMTKQFYHNTGDGRFEDVSARAGQVFASADVGRGAAFGDVDNDGDVDVLVGNAAGPLQLLINDIRLTADTTYHWLGLRVVTAAGRDALGARVTVARGDGSTKEPWGSPSGGQRVRRVRSDGSYASANDPRVIVGLGPVSRPVRVRVQWLDARAEEWADVPVDRWTTIRQGSGR